MQSYVPQRWHQFLIYIGLTVGSFVINAFMNSILPVIYRGACESRSPSSTRFISNDMQLCGRLEVLWLCQLRVLHALLPITTQLSMSSPGGIKFIADYWHPQLCLLRFREYHRMYGFPDNSIMMILLIQPRAWWDRMASGCRCTILTKTTTILTDIPVASRRTWRDCLCKSPRLLQYENTLKPTNFI